MTEQYWIRYQQEKSFDIYHIDDPFWKNVRNTAKLQPQPKHHLELYSICKSDNPYIRQIKASPNITVNTVAEMICRDKGCQLQYCLSLQKIAAQNHRRKIQLNGCVDQYEDMTLCIKQQVSRINRMEAELKSKVLGLGSGRAVQRAEKKQRKKTEEGLIEEYM